MFGVKLRFYDICSASHPIFIAFSRLLNCADAYRLQLELHYSYENANEPILVEVVSRSRAEKLFVAEDFIIAENYQQDYRVLAVSPKNDAFDSTCIAVAFVFYAASVEAIRPIKL